MSQALNKSHSIIFIFVTILLISSLACATLRNPEDPAPTRRPTLPPTPTATYTPAPIYYFGG